MKNDEIVHFYKYEDVADRADGIFNEEKSKIHDLIGDVDVQHVGSCAVPGSICKFDVDINVRVTEDDFEKVQGLLSTLYTPKHEELWKNGLSIFTHHNETQIDIVLTIIDSKYDEYCKVRDYFINNPNELEKYNSMKKEFEGKKYSEYREAKGIFLGKNGECNKL